ncbi:hypothetical protein DH2020_028704 [Rehmannia glutinosa]|uniref:Protein kinase domain-containing protein n=1 Tax=Rehmannia glutinosa TaxID=99300 RepID=A0ABR0VUC9_REHGL
MDLTNWDSIGKTLIHHLNCYKSPELNETILDSSQNGEVLACKSIAKERLVTEDDVRSVKLEIEILTKLSGHENVVDLKAVYEEEDYVHLLMELCAGGELFHQIEKQGRLSEHEAHVIFKQLMEVVMYCHDKGIVHRDLKPENILLVSRSSSSPIKLADFGLATHIKPGQTLHGTVGSPFYIAPEVLVGGYNQAADVWSAGVILYILLSGIPPFWGKTKSTIFDAVRAAKFCFHSDPWDHISTSAKDLISGMLCFDPSKRLTAAQVLGAPLNAFLKNSVVMKIPIFLCSSLLDERYPTGYSRIVQKNNLSCQQLEIGGYSFSNLNVFRDQDFSFHDESPLIVQSEQEDSPVFSCRSSFSKILISNSFNAQFYLFHSYAALEQSDESLCFKTKMLSIDGGTSFLLESVSFASNSQVYKANLIARSCTTHRADVGRNGAEARSPSGGRTSVSKTTSLQSKRNHTIGLGELDHLDLIATVSVSRWASCTQIPSALRSSLVC